MQSLASDLGARGADLLLLEGCASDLIPRIVHLAGAGQLHFDRAYAAALIAEQEYCGNAVEIEIIGHDDYYRHPPGTVLTAAGTPYRVFTAFWKACLERGEPSRPIPPPVHIPGVDDEVMVRLRAQLPVRRLRQVRKMKQQLPAEFAPVELPQERLSARCDAAPLCRIVNCVPCLPYSQLAKMQVWRQTRRRIEIELVSCVGILHHPFLDPGEAGEGGALAGAPRSGQLLGRPVRRKVQAEVTGAPPLRREFEHFAWSPDDDGLRDWQLGRTGYPVVDAGMRELLATGWLHNRARMIVASFLAKNLLISWTTGAAWFMNRLVDADLANNTTNWQWVAGCGTDAAPYFRIWNLTLQGRKFDPEGRYVRRWLPELARLPNACLHEPWLADVRTQQTAECASASNTRCHSSTSGSRGSARWLPIGSYAVWYNRPRRAPVAQ